MMIIIIIMMIIMTQNSGRSLSSWTIQFVFSTGDREHTVSLFDPRVIAT
jgi:hypothetical protein